MKYALRPYQKEASDKAIDFFLDENAPNSIEVLSTGCHAKGYKILMFDGTFKKVEDIVVGDMIMGDNSTPRRVLSLARGVDDMYKVTPIHGDPFIVNGGHILHLYRTCSGFKYKCQESGYDEISVKDYITSSKSYKRTHKLHRSFGVREQKKSIYVTGFNIEYVGKGDYYGFTVDGNHLYCDWQFFVHHNCGKSVIIADIAHRLDDNVLVFGPSKEIIEQDYAKMCSYGEECSMFSASVGQKVISKITFASIGSVKNHVEDFKHFKYVIVDECHLLNSEEGMYINFLSMLECKVIGLTATPYRLTSERYYDIKEKAMRTKNSKLTMLTNEPNPFFKKIIYSVDTHDMVEQGYLARLKYYDARPNGWNERRIFPNASGSDYSNSSIKWMMDKTDHKGHLTNICQRLLYPHNGIPRKGILVFCMFVEDAMDITNELNTREGKVVANYLTGETSKPNRERILNEFKSGELKILINVGTLTTGFDFPELDTVVLGRPTMSLALFYQCVGRAIRPFKGKDGWIVDTVGNSNRFGNVEFLRLIETNGVSEYYGFVRNQWKQLTGVILEKK